MKQVSIKLTSNPTIKFMVNGTWQHSKTWDKSKPDALSGMLTELLNMNYYHYGIEATDKKIAEAAEILKKMMAEPIKDQKTLDC